MNKRLEILICSFAVLGIGSAVTLFSSRTLAQDANKQTVSKGQTFVKAQAVELQGEDEENRKLTSTVSMAQAAAAATGRVNGFANQAILEEDKGKLVWDVEIVTSEQKVFAVEVDATSGAILEVDEETGGDHEDGDGGTASKGN